MGQSRTEDILEATIHDEPYTEPPRSRVEELLLELKEVIEQGGGGGTIVIANPQGEPSEVLQTIQIGSVIFSIAGSSGNATGVKVVDKLYEASTGAGAPLSTDISYLNSHNLTDYDYITVVLSDSVTYAQGNYTQVNSFAPESLMKTPGTSGPDFQHPLLFTAMGNRSCNVAFYKTNFRVLNNYGDNEGEEPSIFRIYGVKLGTSDVEIEANPEGEATETLEKLRVGDSIYGLKPFQKDLLYEAPTLSGAPLQTDIPYFTNKNFFDYDLITLIQCNALDGANDCIQSTHTFTPDELINLDDDGTYTLLCTGYKERYAAVKFSEHSFRIPQHAAVNESGDYAPSIYKMYGFKFGGNGGASSADAVSYSNDESGLVADDVQEAIDEVNGKIVGVEANPSGTATTELSKLKVGSTIYSTPNVYKVMSYDEEIAITYDTTYSYSYWFAQNNVATLNQQSATYKASVPIEVIPNETYSLTIKNFKSTYARAYFITDAQMNIISSSTSSTADETVTYNLTIPSNAKYLCISRKGTSVMPSLIHHVINANIPNTPDNIWKGKKWTCVGDSLTEVNQRASKRYYDYVSETTGISVVNMGESGTGYAMTNRNFYTRITNVPLDSDVITIFGSGNDLSAELDLGDPSDSGTSPTTLCGYINGTIDNLFDIFPLANIGIVTPSPWIYKTPDIPNNNLEKYSNAIVEICKRRSIPYLDLYHISGLHPDSEEFRELAYSKDEGNGVHPDETGHKILAPRFKAFLESLLL